MLAVKENSKEKQDYRKVVEYLIWGGEANVNLQAEKARTIFVTIVVKAWFSMQFAKWSAVFFSIKNKDQKIVEFLFRNKADMQIKDEVSFYG